MMSRQQRKLVWILMAVLFLASVGMSDVLRPGHLEYMRAASGVANGDQVLHDMQASSLAGSGFEALLPTLLGAREVMASLMWVRADDYFHRGEYRPILMMVKEITTIDPHQLDVFATGAWHMAYNFMDKRLIQDGVAFLEDGCKKNESVYDLYFELGYMHYDKTKDFPKAVDAYRIATTKATTTGKKDPPSYVRHQLAHAIEKMGDIDGAIAQWKYNLDKGREVEKSGEYANGPSGPNVAAAEHNLYITQRRANERLASVAERQHNAAEAQRLYQANVDLGNDWLRLHPGRTDVVKDVQAASAEVSRLKGGKLNPVDPANITLHFSVVRTAPRMLIVEGNLDVLNLSRINIVFQDKGYQDRIRPRPGFDALSFKMDNCTLEWDNTAVQHGHFRYNLNLNKDPADMDRPPAEVYPLKADDYDLILTYNPRLQPDFIQDRYGWNGEGLTASPALLHVDPSKAGRVGGKAYPLKTVGTSITLKRADILAPGKAVLFKS